MSFAKQYADHFKQTRYLSPSFTPLLATTFYAFILKISIHPSTPSLPIISRPPSNPYACQNALTIFGSSSSSSPTPLCTISMTAPLPRTTPPWPCFTSPTLMTHSSPTPNDSPSLTRPCCLCCHSGPNFETRSCAKLSPGDVDITVISYFVSP